MNTIHSLFEAQAARRPGATAVACGSTSLTYDELDERSDAIARDLAGMGAGPGRLIGICVDRSVHVAAAVLGVLKSGSAFLPLDPSYPDDRLSRMLDLSGTSLVLTDRHTHGRVEQLRDDTEKELVCIDVEAGPGSRPEVPADAVADTGVRDLAYVIFTSGTTGTPKGVMITHGNLLHYVSSLQDELGIAEDDVYLHTASLAFSSSARQILMPLCHGATLVITTPEERAGPRPLFERIKKSAVSVIDLVPSFHRTCIETLGALPATVRADLTDNSLRLILSASEPLGADIPSGWNALLGRSVPFINMYGLTETSGIVSVHTVDPDTPRDGAITSIGRPIRDVALHVLGPNMDPVVVGEAGELYVGGPTVSVGYIDAGAADASLIDDPFSDVPGALLHRTGDLVRVGAEGELEFVTRTDDQVKIRGQRVQLAEIEAILATHDSVRAAAAKAYARHDGGQRLAAFIVPASPDVAPGILRDHVRAKLPPFMVPAAIAVVDALPLTASGKLDRNALAEPDWSANAPDEDAATSGSRAEQQIAEIVGNVLNVPDV